MKDRVASSCRSTGCKAHRLELANNLTIALGEQLGHREAVQVLADELDAAIGHQRVDATHVQALGTRLTITVAVAAHPLGRRINAAQDVIAIGMVSFVDTVAIAAAR